MGMKTFCLENMKVIYFLQVIFYLIHLTEEKRVQSASMQEVASDCVPKGASLAKYKKASSMQCAHACIANKECSYYAVREMNKKSVRCKLYKEDDLKNGYYKEEGWMVFEKVGCLSIMLQDRFSKVCEKQRRHLPDILRSCPHA